MKKSFIFWYILLSILILRADIVDIKADHFYANNINKVAYFEGNAEIKQGQNEFKAFKITVYFNKRKKQKNMRRKAKSLLI